MRACWPPMGARSISDRRGWTGGAGTFVLALLLVLCIALAQRQGSLDALNLGAMQAAGRARDMAGGAWITLGMQGASLVGSTSGRLLILVVSAALLLWRRGVRTALWLAMTVLAGMLLNVALKQVFAAPRPDLLPHLDIVHTYSFPSGHAAGNMILFGALAMVVAGRSAYGAAALIIVVIGCSRVWLGVHWPSDVLAGWIEGLGWLALCRVWLPFGNKAFPVEQAHVRLR